MSLLSEIRHLPLADLGQFWGTEKAPPIRANIPLTQWQMQRDDAPILAYIFEQAKPKRHLEFGTWQGFGTCLCLENSPASVWTINLPDGETTPEGNWAYGERVPESIEAPLDAVIENFGNDEHGGRIYHRTDAGGYIGRLYRERGLANRVHQILCDSREWDTTGIELGFFDSAFLDGGHTSEVVISDTQKALPLIKSGGLILWHDFSPDQEVIKNSTAVNGVTSAIQSLLPKLRDQLDSLVWIEPSQILLGIKR